MSSEQALRAFEAKLAGFGAAEEVGTAFHQLAQALVGVTLLTITANDIAAGQVRRIYSSHPDSYPILGTKPLEVDAEFEQMRTTGAISVINSAAGMEGNFPDLELIRSLGCNAYLCVPILVGQRLLGTINALDAEGRYSADRVRAARLLVLPAAVTFLILQTHYNL